MLRRTTALWLGVLAVGSALYPAARGDGPATGAGTPPGGVPVEVVTADGTKLTGTLTAPSVRVRAGVGTLDLDVRKLDELTVDPEDDGSLAAAAVAHDHSTFVGRLLADEFAVVVGGETRAVPAKDVRTVTFKHPRDRSALGVAIGLLTLALMEIVLGVDNIIFLAIVAGRLPLEQQPRARRIGLVAALGTRIGLLLTLSWILGMTKPLFTLPDLPLFHTHEARGISVRDLILLAGGMFLIGKSVFEMHEKLEHGGGGAGTGAAAPPAASFASVIAQIAVIDIIFSLDSVVTAVGMVDEVWVMITAMLIAVGVMMVAAEPISRFVDNHPTIKVLALSFLILIGVLLVAEGLGQHMNKGYIYFAMAFGVGVELVNMRLRGSPHPVGQELPPTPTRPTP